MTITVSDLLPDIALPSAPAGFPVRLRPSMGMASVLVAVHGADCAGCQDYLNGLAGSAGEFEAWDGRLLVIAPEPPRRAARMRPPFGSVLSDEGGRIADGANASVIVADRYGQVFSVSQAAHSHGLPAARELEEWLKYLGTLCPE